jgi:hypothetical protein
MMIPAMQEDSRRKGNTLYDRCIVTSNISELLFRDSIVYARLDRLL